MVVVENLVVAKLAIPPDDELRNERLDNIILAAMLGAWVLFNAYVVYIWRKAINTKRDEAKNFRSVMERR